MLCLSLSLYKDSQRQKQGIAICGSVQNLKASGALQGSGDLVAEAKESDGIILAVEIDSTTYAEIARELEICRMQKVTVKGVVVVA